MKSTLLLTILVLMSAAAVCQDAPKQFHVTSTHEWVLTDAPRITKAFTTYVVTGTIGNVKYTTQQTYSWGSQRFEIGTDYPVSKMDDKSIHFTMKNKKGRDIPEVVFITGAEEAKAAN